MILEVILDGLEEGEGYKRLKWEKMYLEWITN